MGAGADSLCSPSNNIRTNFFVLLNIVKPCNFPVTINVIMFKIVILNHKNVATMRIYVIPVTTARVNTVNFHNDIKTTVPKLYQRTRADYKCHVHNIHGINIKYQHDIHPELLNKFNLNFTY